MMSKLVHPSQPASQLTARAVNTQKHYRFHDGETIIRYRKVSYRNYSTIISQTYNATRSAMALSSPAFVSVLDFSPRLDFDIFRRRY